MLSGKAVSPAFPLTAAGCVPLSAGELGPLGTPVEAAPVWPAFLLLLGTSLVIEW